MANNSDSSHQSHGSGATTISGLRRILGVPAYRGYSAAQLQSLDAAAAFGLDEDLRRDADFNTRGVAFLSDPLALNRLSREQRLTICFIYRKKHPAVMKDVAPLFAGSSWTSARNTMLVVMIGEYSIREDNYEIIVLLSGSMDPALTVISIIKDRCEDYSAYPSEVLTSILTVVESEATDLGLVASKLFCVICNVTQAVQLIANPNVDRIVKTVSIVRLLYPWTHGHLLKRFTLVRYNDYASQAGLHAIADDIETDIAHTTNFEVAASILLLSSAYTRPDKFRVQLMARYRALKASYVSEPVNDQAVNTMLDVLNIDVKDRPSVLMELMGYWLSIDTDLQYGETLTIGELADPVNLKQDDVLKHHFPMALMVQGRLVYKGVNMTTAMWAAAIRERVVPLLPALSHPWTEENRALADGTERITNFPYAGLRLSQHTSIQLQLFPRFALLGIGLHKATLDEAGQKEMVHYVSTNLDTNLDNRARSEITTLLSLLDVSVEQVAISLLTKLPFDQADLVASKLSPTQLSAATAKIFLMAERGVWGEEKYQEAKNRHLQTATKTAQTALSEALREKSTSLLRIVSTIDNSAHRLALNGKIEAWVQACSQRIRDLLGPDSLLALSEPAGFRTIFDTLKQEANQIHDTINRFTITRTNSQP